ncbi:MAG: diacylglycerol kinase family protein [Bacteroidetes bacterium]|nr:diacylglycerol kinase family protein [Bacteroidota bacterium]
MRQSFLSSVANASKGLYYAIRTQRNLKIQFVIAILAIITGLWLKITRLEWAAIWLCIGLVIGLEIMNSAIETLLNKLHPGHDPEIGKAKDLAAAAVWIASIASLFTGLYIFLPRLMYR